MKKLGGEAQYYKDRKEAIKKGWRPDVEVSFPWKIFLFGIVLGFILHALLTVGPVPEGFTPQDFGYGQRP